MAHPFEGIEREKAGMGEGMIPDTMSFFIICRSSSSLPFILFPIAKKAGWYVFFS